MTNKRVPARYVGRHNKRVIGVSQNPYVIEDQCEHYHIWKMYDFDCQLRINQEIDKNKRRLINTIFTDCLKECLAILNDGL